MARRLSLLLIFISALDLGAALALFYWLPNTQALSHGVLLERTSAKGKIFSFLAGPKNNKFIPLSQIPRHLQTAVIVLEDAKFFQHYGFDWEEIINAISSTLEDGTKLRGASSITQQLAKNLYLNPERTFKRKILEAFITIKLELTLSKGQILELYLNSIDWGRGLLGISDATAYYFKKTPSQLNLRESVFLAAIVPNPSIFGRFTDEQMPKAFVRKQMMKALPIMYKMGSIKFQEFQDMMDNPYVFNTEEF